MSSRNSGRAKAFLTAIIVVLIMGFAPVVPAFASAPSISSFTPAIGGPGTTVTITGSGFAAESLTVRVQGVALAQESIELVSDTSVKVKVPAGEGEISFTIETVSGSAVSSGVFTYAPTIDSISPSSGPLAGGIEVAIVGTNFLDVSAVSFGGVPATRVTVVSPSLIRAIAPSRLAGATSISVTAKGGSVNRPSAYTYVRLSPTVTSLSPTTGGVSGGVSVVIRGTNFIAVSGAGAVRFGEINATSYVVNSATQITAVAPPGAAGLVSVSVVAADGSATLMGAFTYRENASDQGARETIFFSTNRSEIRPLQFDAIQRLMALSSGREGIRISLSATTHKSSPKSLGKSRTNSVRALLELVGFGKANVSYSLFHKRTSSGSASTKKNNRVLVSISWTR
jgi:hypothetical protein